jgi:DnaJ-class molecular chaperone
MIIPAGVQSGQTLRLRGRGLPGKEAGDQYVQLKVVLPEATSLPARALCEETHRTLAFELLKEAHALTGNCEYVFTNPGRRTRPMSNNMLNGALHALGFKDEMTDHGFRTLASTRWDFLPM